MNESPACGLPKHPNRSPVPSGSVAALNKVIRAFAPSGSHREVLALFHNRVTWSAIQHWRKGRRHVPQWAIDCLMQRAEPILKLTSGPGSVVGKYNLPTMRAQKEKAALSDGS